MKKTAAILLTLALAFVMLVPSFAATLNKDKTSGDVIIKTSTTEDVDGKDPKKYSVEIPADTVIPWGTESTALTYTVESHLGDGESVKVVVTNSGENKMTYQGNFGTYTLPYVLSGQQSYAAASPVVYPAEACEVKVDISADDWNKAVVGEYSDLLTFTASVETQTV